MSDRAGLERILNELRAASSPVERVKMLGRAWRTLRRLDRDQLQELARRAGLDRAEGFLERLARDKGRFTPSLLLQIVRRVKEVDSGEVDDLVRSLRDPGRRDDLLRDGIEVVEDLLDASEPEAVEATPTPSPEIEPPQAEPAVVLQPETESSGSSPATEPEPEPKSDPFPRRVPAAAPVSAAVRPAVLTRVEPPPIVPPAEPLPAKSTPAVGRGSDRVQQSAVEPADLVDRLTEAPSALRRLGLLRQALTDVGPIDLDDLRQVLDLFPDGWARRRALAALLQAGLPPTFEHALLLIEQLASPAAQRWCAAALVDRQPLDPEDRRTLIERHGLFPHRRRAAATEGRASR